MASPGELISKERFHHDIWDGVPVTDDALTQCIRTLRKALGDRASDPRYIQTVPKHGYRFVIEVEPDANAAQQSVSLPMATSHSVQSGRVVFARLVGGGFAGVFGGLFYGLTGALGDVSDQGVSAMVAMLAINIIVGAAGGSAIGVAILFVGDRKPALPLAALAGLIGGGLIGALSSLVGVQVLEQVFGYAGGRITGTFEGAVLGLTVGGMVGFESKRFEAGMAISALLMRVAIAGLIAGGVIGILGGTLMAGSVNQLSLALPESGSDMRAVARLFGETQFGWISHMAGCLLESALFVTCMVYAIDWAQRWIEYTPPLSHTIDPSIGRST